MRRADDEHQAKDRYGVSFFLLCLVTGAGMIVGGVLTRAHGLVIPGALVAVGSLGSIWVGARGHRTGRWMSAASRPPQRAHYVLALAGSAAFVLVGIAAIVYGADAGRSDAIVVGILSCLFFGGGGLMAAMRWRDSI